ncbi:DUF1217 domain-containing protein [Halovulum sp. GXIMD14794]
MYQPVIPLSGIAGWSFLGRTQAAQMQSFEQSPQMARETEYFLENISAVTSAEELVQDRRLLAVALGAFGLGDEIGKTAFLQKILGEGTEDSEALANKFVDPRYAAFSRAFGFGDSGGPQVANAGFGKEIVNSYKQQQFEISVGNVDEPMRLALTFQREIGDLAAAAKQGTGGTQWYQLMGSQPLRTVVEAAFGLPAQFSGLDVDRQRETLEDKANQLFGSRSPAVFEDPEAVETMINRFLARRQAEQGPTAGTPGIGALTLLQSSGGGVTNLILSTISQG